jgi:hypothetical protein
VARKRSIKRRVRAKYQSGAKRVHKKVSHYAGRYLAKRRHAGKRGGKVAHYAGRYLARRRYAGRKKTTTRRRKKR